MIFIRSARDTPTARHRAAGGGCGVQAHRTGPQIDIIGTDGVMRLTNQHAFQNQADHKIESMKNGAAAFAELEVPAEYAYLPVEGLDASARDVSYIYST